MDPNTTDDTPSLAAITEQIAALELQRARLELPVIQAAQADFNGEYGDDLMARIAAAHDALGDGHSRQVLFNLAQVFSAAKTVLTNEAARLDALINPKLAAGEGEDK